MATQCTCSGKEMQERRSYHRSEMQKERIIEKLKESGCRITQQRLLILDIILQQECSCCKEIYYKASKIDENIGKATVYRMVNTLEEIGAINRSNMYKVLYSQECTSDKQYTITLDDGTAYLLSAKKWNEIILAGLTSYGYVKHQMITSIHMDEKEESCVYK
ncbi:Fur family transcriptional regulator [Anaerosporobacter faecicola]|uniref:Fur family transcriptional regulator n=1 Tax=Anaerosporobacter faecicola TaxID=2718714 RepID=UPI001EE518EF|nr:transcriptional repressor [Anaerosporobacter faecicola]